MTKTLRNVLIILGLAAVVLYVPGGGTGGAVVGQALSIVFLGSLAWFGVPAEHRRRPAPSPLPTGTGSC